MQRHNLFQPNGLSTTFGAELFALREAKGLSQAELARRAILSRSYLSEVENDRRPPPGMEICQRIFDALQLNAEERSRLWAIVLFECSSEQPCGVGNLAALIGDLGRLLPRLTPDRIEIGRAHV